MPEIIARELRERLERGDAPLLVDVLFEEQHARRRLPGAVSACVYNVTFLDQVAELAGSRDREVLVYGAGRGDASAEVAEDKLLRAGYPSVLRLVGGIDAWAEEGGGLEGDDTGASEDLERVFAPEDRQYTALPVENSVAWEGRNANGSHHGSLRISEGRFEFLNGRADGEVRLDMGSIENEDLEEQGLRGLLVSHLLSDDFFDAANHPEAVLLVSRMEPLDREPGQPNYRLSGMLEMRGVSKPFACEATLANLDQGRIALEAHFDLDRTEWGVNYGSGKLFRFLGYHLVYDPVSVRVRLVLE